MWDAAVPGTGWVNMKCVWRWNSEFVAVENIGKMLKEGCSTCRTNSVRPCRSWFIVWRFWRTDRALPLEKGFLPSKMTRLACFGLF